MRVRHGDNVGLRYLPKVIYETHADGKNKTRPTIN